MCKCFCKVLPMCQCFCKVLPMCKCFVRCYQCVNVFEVDTYVTIFAFLYNMANVKSVHNVVPLTLIFFIFSIINRYF